MRWRLSALLLSCSMLAVSPAARAQDAPQPVNPFGGGGGNQPPAPPPANPFGGGDVGQQPAAPAQAAAPDPTGGDPAKQQKLLDEMVAKKVLFKANVKGRQASLWVGNDFAELPEDQQTNLARAAYKIWVIGTEPKFKGPMTLYLSDGQKPSARLGMYVVTLRGDGLKLLRSKRQQQATYNAGFVPPVAPVEPPEDPNDPFNM
ncbi:MAG TPA: hypothetical protein VIK18_19275 [Pirellulales bacterium]